MYNDAAPTFYVDPRYPAMDPLACTETGSRPGRPHVCAVVVGSLYVYPAIKLHESSCNGCATDECRAADKLNLDFHTSFLIKPNWQGPFAEHPLVDDDDPDSEAWEALHYLLAFGTGQVFFDHFTERAFPITENLARCANLTSRRLKADEDDKSRPPGDDSSDDGDDDGPKDKTDDDGSKDKTGGPHPALSDEDACELLDTYIRTNLLKAACALSWDVVAISTRALSAMRVFRQGHKRLLQ